jgi:hypothetical protein
MRRELGPSWTSRQLAAAERHRSAWKEFFDAEGKGGGEFRLGGTRDREIAAVQARHERELLRYPNVVGVAPGTCIRRGKPVDEPCLVVYVGRKVPKGRLRRGEILPTEIDGVPVDVVEVGRIEPLPS